MTRWTQKGTPVPSNAQSLLTSSDLQRRPSTKFIFLQKESQNLYPLGTGALLLSSRGASRGKPTPGSKRTAEKRALPLSCDSHHACSEKQDSESPVQNNQTREDIEGIQAVRLSLSAGRTTDTERQKNSPEPLQQAPHRNSVNKPLAFPHTNKDKRKRKQGSWPGFQPSARGREVEGLSGGNGRTLVKRNQTPRNGKTSQAAEQTLLKSPSYQKRFSVVPTSLDGPFTETE